MTARAHADVETLVRYWLGELDGPAEADLDEHLLGCDRCGHALDELVALAGGIREAFARGTLHAFVTEGFVRRLGEQGTRLREYRVPRGGSVNCTILPEDRFVVAHLQAPLEGVARVDAFVDAVGESHAFHDVPFDAAHGTVVLVSRTATLREMPSHLARIRLVAAEGRGERELGTYAFHHTRHGD
jgi:anti-sigma factor RsiW